MHECSSGSSLLVKASCLRADQGVTEYPDVQSRHKIQGSEPNGVFRRKEAIRRHIAAGIAAVARHVNGSSAKRK